jgi:hypothetical protein
LRERRCSSNASLSSSMGPTGCPAKIHAAGRQFQFL